MYGVIITNNSKNNKTPIVLVDLVLYSMDFVIYFLFGQEKKHHFVSYQCTKSVE